MIPLDSQLNLILQNLLGTGFAITAFMNAVTFLGSVAFMTLYVAAVYWCIDTKLGIRLGIALFSACAIYSSLKLAFHLPRPYWADSRVAAMNVESSYGFPSGHSMMAAAVWGLTGLRTRKIGGILASLALILLIAASRLYLGVHFSADVAGGLILGFLLIALIAILDRPVSRWASNTNPLAVFLISTLIGVILLGIGYVFYTQLIPWSIPGEWNQQFASSMHPATMKDIVESAGMWLGFTGGICWLKALAEKIGRFNSAGSKSQLLWRLAVGIAGILFLYSIFGLMIPHNEAVFTMALRLVRSGATGFWIGGLAPFVFIKTGLTIPAKA